MYQMFHPMLQNGGFGGNQSVRNTNLKQNILHFERFSKTVVYQCTIVQTMIGCNFCLFFFTILDRFDILPGKLTTALLLPRRLKQGKVPLNKIQNLYIWRLQLFWVEILYYLFLNDTYFLLIV